MVDSYLFHPHWQSSRLQAGATIQDAMGAISRSAANMACIVDDRDHLQAILTDADIRRAILTGHGVHDEAAAIANFHPTTGHHKSDATTLAALAKAKGVREIPLVDENHCLRDIFIVNGFDRRRPRKNVLTVEKPSCSLPHSMLILAGGLGLRLRSVVQDRPKPLAEVGGRPIIETVIRKAAACGINHFYVAVNYKAEQIEHHINSTDYEGLSFTIIKENSRLGTAGAIGLIKPAPDLPLLVGNADVLTSVPLEQMLFQHQESGAQMTCAVNTYKINIPYGVTEISGDSIIAIHEKPQYTYFFNAGLYVLEPKVCGMVEENQPLDMPELMNQVLESHGKIHPFLIHEFWSDIGEPKEYHRANAEYADVFEPSLEAHDQRLGHEKSS